ncbi:hypothetical protein [Mucilaginibacter boryungensis]|uniref:Uncharacterized protein n=1 Tax=Mucilaginibacter boryungensis TaxID=768480 RepID=A0ABR9XHC4_9SPHI|nr:hypothetical protein [Mucilaginibacter boryungensis]MBE9666782.1 hypothetical protein [Mucilaginibacter boryungensis]
MVRLIRITNLKVINYSQLMGERVASFLQVYAALPLPKEIPAELLVMSAGYQKGNFSFRHVFTEGETVYFIFRKAGLTDGLQAAWECVDRELELLAKEHLVNATVVPVGKAS